MIVYHQNNVAAFAGNHVYYMLRPHGYASYLVSVTSAAPSVTIIAQARTVARFVQSRVYSRVN